MDYNQVYMKIIAFTDGHSGNARKLIKKIKGLKVISKWVTGSSKLPDIRTVYNDALHCGFGTVDSLVIIAEDKVYHRFEEGDGLTEEQVDKLRKTFSDPKIEPLSLEGKPDDTVIFDFWKETAKYIYR